MANFQPSFFLHLHISTTFRQPSLVNYRQPFFFLVTTSYNLLMTVATYLSSSFSMDHCWPLSTTISSNCFQKIIENQLLQSMRPTFDINILMTVVDQLSTNSYDQPTIIVFHSSSSTTFDYLPNDHQFHELILSL